MKLFLDSANLKEIEDSLSRGFISGITTNPSIISREKQSDFFDHIEKIISLINQYGKPIPLSVEVSSLDQDEMIIQATYISYRFASYPQLYIKIPIGWNELEVIYKLQRKGIKINCTACMSYNQSIMAANARVSYLSLFWGRIKDSGENPTRVLSEVTQTLRHESLTKVIVGSIRHIDDIGEAIRAGADIITVPAKFFPKMCTHPQTDKVVAQFISDFSAWSST